MIELTDEQAENIFYSLELAEHWSEEESSFDFVKENIEKFLINEIRIDQIKQLAELYNASVCEWVEFDGNIKNTPKLNGGFSEKVMTNIGIMYLCNYGITGETWWQDNSGTRFPLDYVEKWCYLPKLTEE